MPFIGTQPEVGGYSVLDALTASATASYTLQKDSANFIPNTANQLLVSLNGVIQKPGSSFTVSGSTLTFSSALTSSDSIDFIIAMGEPLLIGTPSDGTVTTNKLVNDSVTGAKIENNPTIAGNLTVSGTSTLTGASNLNGGATVSSGTLNMSSSLLQFAGNISLPNVGACLFRPAADTIAFGINNGQRVSVNQHGLLFGTDTAAANALDDYEEGTWTPTLRGESGTEPAQNSATARYVKMGQLVHIEARVSMGADNGGSGMEMVGLPFASQNAVIFHMAETAQYGVVGAFFSNGSVAAGSGLVFFRQGGDGTSAWKSGTYVQRANGQYTVVGTYTTAS